MVLLFGDITNKILSIVLSAVLYTMTPMIWILVYLYTVKKILSWYFVPTSNVIAYKDILEKNSEGIDISKDEIDYDKISKIFNNILSYENILISKVYWIS